LLITYEIFFLGSTFHVAATILKTVCDHPNRSKLRGIHFKITWRSSIPWNWS